MKKVSVIYLIIVTLVISVVLTSCEKYDDTPPFKIEGLSFENFPIIDGSTSAEPLVVLIACKLLDVDYKWEQLLYLDGSWHLRSDLPKEFSEKHLKSSQTHNSFINLIENEVDMILSARAMSADEKAYAVEMGVNLIETPIALDALIFVTNYENQIKSLTHKQLQDIYTGKIKNWKDVSGKDLPIVPYVRNKNSGSQELMEALVLTEPISEDSYEDETRIGGMMPLLSRVQEDRSGIGYTVYYYKENIVRDIVSLNTLAVNGVYPEKNTIRNRKYPFTSEVYVIIRSDLNKSSMAYKLYELLQTTTGKRVISESGYIPN